MITIYRKAFFYEQLRIGKGSFFEVPIMQHVQRNARNNDLLLNFIG